MSIIPVMAKRADGSREYRRGEGAVYRDKSAGVWVASVSLGWRDGKRIRRRVTAPSKDIARLELSRLRQAYGTAGESALLPLGKYLDQWLGVVRPTITPSTWTSYSGHVKTHITPLLGNITVARLRPADVERLIAERLSAGKSPATVQRILVTLRMALDVLVKRGELQRNPAAMVRPPRVERHPVEAMTPTMAENILDAVKDDRLAALYVLLLGTGMRLGEATALDWRDVRADSVFIRKGKTKAATRTVPLPPFVIEALDDHRNLTPRYGPGEPVFLGEQGERLRGDYVSHAFPKLLRRKKVIGDDERFRVHDLRHGTATLLLQRGVPMREIADILGHANPAVTAQVYAHVSEDQKRSAMQKLEDIGSRNGSRSA